MSDEPREHLCPHCDEILTGPTHDSVGCVHHRSCCAKCHSVSDEPRERRSLTDDWPVHVVCNPSVAPILAAVLAEVARQDVHGVGGKVPGETFEAMHVRAAAAHITVLLRISKESK